jgi:hypothetical protein
MKYFSVELLLAVLFAVAHGTDGVDIRGGGGGGATTTSSSILTKAEQFEQLKDNAIAGARRRKLEKKE